MRNWDTDGVPFAIDSFGNFRDVASVERGLQCGCYCAACKGELVAKKGEVRVHHFAHRDRRECRHALEASLYGMLMTMLGEPGATLRLPGCGTWAPLLPPGTSVLELGSIFPSAYLLPETDLELGSAAVASTDINMSACEQPDIVTPTCVVHVLSHRKTRAAISKLAAPENCAALCLDLRRYAELWWTVCERSKAAAIQDAETATTTLRNWLQRSTEGREWLHHPQLEAKQNEATQRIRNWMQARAKERRQKEVYVYPLPTPTRRESLRVAEPAPAPPTPTALPPAIAGAPAVYREEGVVRLHHGRLRDALDAAARSMAPRPAYVFVYGRSPSEALTRDDATALFFVDGEKRVRANRAAIEPGVPVAYIYPDRTGVRLREEATGSDQLLLT